MWAGNERRAAAVAGGGPGDVRLPHWEEYQRGPVAAIGIAAHYLRGAAGKMLRIILQGQPGVAILPGGRLDRRMPDVPEILHNAIAHRYEATVDGHLSVCEYELDGGRMVFTHTVVPPELRGRGIAEKLVRAALADARTTGRKVVPACSYVAKFIERNQEFQDLLAG